MAKGDTFNAIVGDEIELTFQLNLKRAEIQKRRDAADLTHVSIEFIQEPVKDQVAEGGQITFEHLSADATGDPNTNEILPITQDDPKFTRLYRVGPMTDLSGRPKSDMTVLVRAALVPKDGEKKASTVPADKVLCKIRVKATK